MVTIKLGKLGATMGQVGTVARELLASGKVTQAALKACYIKCYAQMTAHRKRIAELTNRNKWLERQLGFQGGG